MPGSWLDDDLDVDVDELRARLLESTDEAFRLADDLAHEFATGGDARKVAELAAGYLKQRRLVRRLKSALRVQVAG